MNPDCNYVIGHNAHSTHAQSTCGGGGGMVYDRVNTKHETKTSNSKHEAKTHGKLLQFKVIQINLLSSASSGGTLGVGS